MGAGRPPWTAANPGTYGASSATNRSFRVRAVHSEGVTMVGDRGMIRTDQKAAAQAADFHFITALTKPQIQKLLTDQVLQMELFEDKASKEHPRAKAQTQRRTLERVWCSLEITIKDGLRKLEKLCVMELVHPQSGDVVARQVSDLSPRQKQLLDPLKLGLPATVPEAQLLVGFVE